MGQTESKRELSRNGAVKDGGVVEDISKLVTDSGDDLDESKYRIVITCKGDNRLPKNTKVTPDISGDENRHLKVVANNKMYFNSPLPKAATNCDTQIVKKDKVDLLHLTITKAVEGYWTTKKK